MDGMDLGWNSDGWSKAIIFINTRCFFALLLVLLGLSSAFQLMGGEGIPYRMIPRVFRYELAIWSGWMRWAEKGGVRRRET
jgi:hypothetical protein